MTFRFGYTEATILVVTALLVIAMLFLPDYDRPPITSVQNGYRGTGMLQVYNPREVVEIAAEQQPLEIEGLPPLVTAGPRAVDVYENVQVLQDLSAAQFLRLMTAITEWVSPEAGCNYCHQGNQFANDDLYTKRVSRWMIAMTRSINNDWASHVLNAWDGEADGAGVTCYTCHRGNNVPQYVWYRDPELVGESMGLVGYRADQNRPAEVTTLASLPADPFSEHLRDVDTVNSDWIRVQSESALPAGNRSSIKQTELTYSLMIHMSDSLGVNCTYCHNSRAWGSWEQSTPQRVNAWYGIQMVQAVNTLWIEPTTVALPDYRLGPLGDPAKVNCTTCHQGVFKPLYGANMLEDFPSLAEPNPVDRETLEPGLADPAVSMQIGRELETAAADAQAEAPAAEADGDAQATPPAADATEGDAEAAAAPAEEGTDAADAGTDAAEAPAADDGTETAQ
jgi:photosynthetic reaction center cytochrome c subunit